MKRFGILLCIVLVFAAMPVFAEESTLIDFSTLVVDRDDGENEATFIDFSDKAGAGFTQEEKKFMKTSLAIANWEVELASSARTVTNTRYSYVKPAVGRSDASRYANETVLGVRIHFVDEPYNSWAIVKPPFEIPSYEDRFVGNGILKNVGVIKSITVNVLGKNRPTGFAVILEDENHKEHNYFMGYLDFDGWKTITWNNPGYIEDVRDRELSKEPLYPNPDPFLRFVGFVFYKNADQQGGDFVSYVKDVIVTYDKAVLDIEGDIDDEDTWNIREEREEARRNIEYKELGNIQVLRFIERQLKHPEEEAETRPAE